MKIKILLLLLISCIFIFPQNRFKIDFDFARFNYSDSAGYIEIFYSFYQPQLTINSVEAEKNIKGILKVAINNSSNDVVVNKTYSFQNVLSVQDSANNKSLTGNIAFLLPHGEYTCFLSGIDGNDSTKIDTVSFGFNLSKIPDDRFSISDLELASNIKQSDDSLSMFYKNTYEVIPNPGSIYGDSSPVLYFYSEIYNLNKDIQSEYLALSHMVIDSYKKIVYNKKKLVSRKINSMVEVGAINISKIPSGAYILLLSAADSAKNLTIYSSKKFFIYNPSIEDTASKELSETSVMTSEFATLSEEELNETFAFSKYVSTSQETKQWNSLTSADAKKTFLFNFWKSRDIDLSTSVNEYKKEYFSRVEEANKKFSNIQKKGWKTDRGRVLITYGEPSEIERYPNQVDTRPYEIWSYNHLEGGAVFVFADLTGFSDYQLIHSSLRGELRDDSWQRKVSTY